MAEIQLPDGNFVDVPNFALESTSQEMLKIMEAQLGSNKEAMAIYEKLLDDAKEQTKQDKNEQAQTQEFRRKQAENFKELIDTVGKDTAGGRFARDLGETTVIASQGLMSLGKKAVPGVITAFGILKSSVLNVGSTLGELTQVGVGFTDAGGSAIDALSNVRQLGLDAKQAANLLAGYSNVVQTVGKQSFGELQSAFATASNFGSEFGMTMSEASDILAEDLDRRQRLGILNELDANRAAKRSADLFDQQLEATTLLGKSIDDIRGASEETLTSNAQAALRIQSIAAQLDPEAARDFTRGIERALGDLSAAGLDQTLINTIGAAATEVVAFGSDATAELFSAVAVLDSKAGTAINETVRAANELSKTDPQAAQRMLNNLDEEFMEAASSLSGADFQELQATLAMQGAQGEALALSLAQLRTAARNLEENLGQEFDVEGLAKGAAAFDQALNQVQGSLGSLFTGIAGTFSGPMEAFAEAFTEDSEGVNSVLQSLMNSVSAVGTALTGPQGLFTRLFDTGDATASLADKIRVFADEQLSTLTDRVVQFIEDFDVDQFKEGVKSFIDGLKSAFRTLSAVGSGLMKVFGMFVDTKEVEDPETGETRTQIDGLNWGAIALGVLSVVGVKALMAAAAPIVLAKVAAGAGVSAASSTASTVAAAGSRAGGGIMGGIGAGLKGLAGGLRAFANPAALAGLAAVTVAINGIALAVRVAAPGIEAFGEAFKSTLEGIGTVIGNVGNAIKTVFEGAGSYVESIGTSIASVAEGIAEAVTKIKTAGAESEAIKLEAQADVVERLSAIPTENIVSISQAIGEITNSLSEFSGTVGRDGLLGDSGADLDKQSQQLNLFERIGSMNAEGITATALSMDKIAEVYQKFADLDSDAMFASARAIEAVNRSVEPDEEGIAERIGQGLVRAGQSIVEYGVNLVGGGANAPAPQLENAQATETTAQTANQTAGGTDKTQQEILASIAMSSDKTNRLIRELTDTVRDS